MSSGEVIEHHVASVLALTMGDYRAGGYLPNGAGQSRAW